MALKAFSGLADVTPASGDKVMIQDATTGVLQFATVGDAATADPAAITTGALTITYTTDDPAITANGATTVADGDTPTVQELLELCVELNALVVTLKADVTAVRTSLVALLAETAFVR